jgi:hypothetical protein
VSGVLLVVKTHRAAFVFRSYQMLYQQLQVMTANHAELSRETMWAQ